MNEIVRARERGRSVPRFGSADAPAALLIAALPVACSAPDSAPKPPLAGARIGGPFTLTDQDGKTVSDRDFAGKYRIIYFGYTFCPDVCPVDVQKMARRCARSTRAIRRSRRRSCRSSSPSIPSATRRRCSSSSSRDFHPRMIGLTGSPAAIAAVAKDYAVYYQEGRGHAGWRLSGRSQPRRLSDGSRTASRSRCCRSDQDARRRSPRNSGAGSHERALLGNDAARGSSTARSGKPCATAAANAASTSSRTRRPASCMPTNVACRLLDRAPRNVRDYQAPPRLCPRMRPADAATMSARSTGCPRPAPIACAPRASRCPNGIIWSAAIAKRCTAPANRCAAGRSRRTMPAISSTIWSIASCERNGSTNRPQRPRAPRATVGRSGAAARCG